LFAIIKSGGKQYKVEEGQVLHVESLEAEPGQSVEIRDVLLVDTEDAVLVGTPVIQNVTVQATVVGEGQGEKVLVFKKKKKKQYRRFKGHRQEYTALKIDKIQIQTE